MRNLRTITTAQFENGSHPAKQTGFAVPIALYKISRSSVGHGGRAG